jgi:hypothetical protein
MANSSCQIKWGLCSHWWYKSSVVPPVQGLAVALLELPDPEDEGSMLPSYISNYQSKCRYIQAWIFTNITVGTRALTVQCTKGCSVQWDFTKVISEYAVQTWSTALENWQNVIIWHCYQISKIKTSTVMLLLQVSYICKIQVITHLAIVANCKLGKKQGAVPCKSVYCTVACK